MIAAEALQDINPSNAQRAPKQKFLTNQTRFQAIAEKKIGAGAINPVAINSADVLA
jgi:hypothetical protein